MKTNFRYIGIAALLALSEHSLIAQKEPLMGVEIVSIRVRSGSGALLGATITAGGSGYGTAPAVTVAGGGGSGAAVTATVSAGVVTGLVVTSGGSGYTSLPTITIASPGTQATGTASVSLAGAVSGITLGSAGSGYVTAPTVTITDTGGTGTGAVATATVSGGQVTAITLTAGGTGYSPSSPPTVTISPPGTQATATASALGMLFVQPFENESYGPVRTTIDMTAAAYGTFPVTGFTYNFFVNGEALGTSTVPQPPGGGPGAVSWAPPQPGSYLLTVQASDGAHTATSLAVRYFATGTAMIGPVDNTLVPNGSSLVLQATATPAPTAPNAFVQRIEFYVDGVLVGTDTTYPYSFIYTPTNSPSTHVLEARGFDNNGNQISPNGTATRRVHMVTPIGTVPTVRIANPPTGSNVTAGSPVNIITDAVAPGGFIKNVDFYVNGVLLSSSQTFPFTASWTPQVPGRYEFVSIAYDDKSNAVASAPITLTATGAFPTASIVTPATSGVTVVQGATLPVTVRAAGPDGGVSSLRSIEFLVDGAVNDVLPRAGSTTGTGTTGGTGGTGTGGTGGTGTTTTTTVLTEPFVFNWRANVALGSHRLAARVTDANGLQITSSEVTVNVIANLPPQVVLTAPTTSSSFVAGSPATLSATASDTDGSIVSVEFFSSGVSVGRATSSPYSITWTPTNPGSVDITARATDNGGASTTSDAVSITIDPQSAGTDTGTTTIANTVYRGDYASPTETGRFAFALNRNSRGTLIAFSTTPKGRTYFWSDIPVGADGTFTVRDGNDQAIVTGQTSATGVSGRFSDKTFIGPVTIGSSAVTPLLFTGTLTGVPNSQAVAIVGGDNSITLYVASGNNREAGQDFLSSTGSYAFTAATGGRFSGTFTNAAGIVSGSTSGSVTGAFLLRQQASRITNISARAQAGTGDRTLVAGFVVSGTGAKPLMVRAVGPTLANFGVVAPLNDPTLSVGSATATLASNNDWENSAAITALFSRVGAFPLPVGSRDSVVQVSVNPGSFLAIVGGNGAVTGSALVEIYDTDTSVSPTSRIANISTRGQIGAGESLIAGFVVAGDQRKRLLIRAVGPTLANFGLAGVLPDPRIDVLSGTTSVASNNDWTDPSVASQVSSAGTLAGAFPLNANSKDAGMVLQLNPGSYTVQVSGVGGSSGTTLVEIYDIDRP